MSIGTTALEARASRLALAVLTMVALPTLSGCGDSDPEVGTTTSDSSGVRIVATGQEGWAEPIPVELRPILQVPLPEDASAPDLSVVTAAELLRDGSVAVLDGQLDQVVIFGPDGRTRATVGGSGQAPGEFLGPVSLRLTKEGRLRVYDARLGRMTDIRPDGTMAGVFTLPSRLFPRPPRLAWRLDDQKVLTWEYDLEGRRSVVRSGNAARVLVPGRVRVVDLDTGASDTLYTAEAREMIGEGPRIWLAPFGVTATMQYRDGLLYFTTGRHHEVVVIDPTEGVTRIFRYPDADEAVPEEELDRLRADAREEAAETSQPLSVTFLFDEALQPETRPAFERLQAAGDGRIWARRFMPFREPSPHWWFLSSDGVFQGRAELPGTSEILAVREDRFVLRVVDEFDVPSIQVLEIPEEMR